MYIRPDNQTSPLSVYRQQQTDKVREERQGRGRAAEGGATGDVVSLSTDARILAEAQRSAQEAPEVRQDKVDALKEQVQNGTYTVDNRRVAQGLLREDINLFV